MIIGIDASRAFLKRRTGIEEYSYQVIRHLRDVLPAEHRVVLYVRKKFHFWSFKKELPLIDFELPQHWEVRGLWAPRFWTQIALSLEMLLRPPEVLFVPAHTVPLLHPRRTVVTIHGLEYEFCRAAYSFWERLYMRYSISFSCRSASTVICVSENTKKDVMRFYHVPEEKVRVIYEGYEGTSRQDLIVAKPVEGQVSPYLLFIGRLEERKNVVRIIKAFEILKERFLIPHQLILVGKPGYGYERICEAITRSPYAVEIVERGYVPEEEKWRLLSEADIFLFPSLYEGFGIPVLEAQSVGVSVVTSNVSSLPEVAGEGAVLVDPLRPESIAEGVQKLLSDPELRGAIIKKAAHNVNRFGWVSCTQQIGTLMELDVISFS